MGERLRIFVSYRFDDRDKWVEDYAIPMISALGFEVVSGRHMEGEPLAAEVDSRLKSCAICVAFTSRRYPDNPRPNGTFESHPWVIQEMTKAREGGIKTIEVREERVQIGDGNEAIVHLPFSNDARDKMLSALAVRLGDLKKKTITVQLVPPENDEQQFRRQAMGGNSTCSYEIECNGQVVGRGTAKIKPVTGGFFASIEVPDGSFIVTLAVDKVPAGAWKSFGDGLVAIPIRLYET